MEKIYLWSYRFSVARGWHWVRERPIVKGYEKEWLEVFQKDEPNVKFTISSNKPKVI